MSQHREVNQIKIHKKYEPLFALLKYGYMPEVDTVIMTGGRSSGKSYVVAMHSLIAMVNYNWSVLYTRYTNMSIEDSVKPEVSQKIELLGFDGVVKDTQTHIEHGNNKISFKGIKTGSNVQTASLKSLQGFNCFVVDEAEELPDYKTFKKVFYSIRSANKRNLTILILNPTTKEHWIYQEFFEKKGIPDGFNGTKDNVMYIHTSYFDVDPQYIPENIRKDYQRLKVTNPTEYNNIVLGGWIENPEGILLPRHSLHFDDLSRLSPSQCVYRFAVGDPADKGGDKFSSIFVWMSHTGSGIKCYVKKVLHNTYGIMQNTPLIINNVKSCAIDEIFIESNGVGTASVVDLHRTLKQNGATRLTPVPATDNKEVRILSNYEFIRDFFVFDSNYKSDPEYNSFINDLVSYVVGGKNEHKKDAIDVLSTASQIIKIKFSKFIY